MTGQDPAGLDRLDLFQRGQGLVVIFVPGTGGAVLRAGLAAGKAERRQGVAQRSGRHGRAGQGRVSGGVAGRVG